MRMAIGLPSVEYVRPRPSVSTCSLALCTHLFSILGMCAPAALKVRVLGAEPGGLPGAAHTPIAWCTCSHADGCACWGAKPGALPGAALTLNAWVHLWRGTSARWAQSQECQAQPIPYLHGATFVATDGGACWAQSQEDYLALTRAGVGVSLDGRRVTAPPGVVDADGFANLTSRIKKRA